MKRNCNDFHKIVYKIKLKDQKTYSSQRRKFSDKDTTIEASEDKQEKSEQPLCEIFNNCPNSSIILVLIIFESFTFHQKQLLPFSIVLLVKSRSLRSSSSQSWIFAMFLCNVRIPCFVVVLVHFQKE